MQNDYLVWYSWSISSYALHTSFMKCCTVQSATGPILKYCNHSWNPAANYIVQKYSCFYHSMIICLQNTENRHPTTQIAKTIELPSITHRSKLDVSYRYLIDINLRVYNIWASTWKSNLWYIFLVETMIYIKPLLLKCHTQYYVIIDHAIRRPYVSFGLNNMLG